MAVISATGSVPDWAANHVNKSRFSAGERCWASCLISAKVMGFNLIGAGMKSMLPGGCARLRRRRGRSVSFRGLTAGRGRSDFSGMATITLENVPESVQRGLEARARRHARSLAEEIVQTLRLTVEDDAARDAARHRSDERLARQQARFRELGIGPMTAEETTAAKETGRE